MSAKKRRPAGYPIVQGDYDLTDKWSIHLPEPFYRRVEDGNLVLWRPGLTIWLAAWGNDKNQTQAERLAWISSDAAPGRFAEQKSVESGLTRFSYRLSGPSEDEPAQSLYAYVIGDDGHLQMAIYFDDVADESKARQLVDSVAIR